MMRPIGALLSSLLLAATACGSPAPSPQTPAPTEPTEPGEPGVPGEPGQPGEAASGGCVASGCSGTVCVEAGKEMMTTCEWKDEYACYGAYSACARQDDGTCGWNDTEALTGCLLSPPGA